MQMSCQDNKVLTFLNTICHMYTTDQNHNTEDKYIISLNEIVSKNGKPFFV